MIALKRASPSLESKLHPAPAEPNRASISSLSLCMLSLHLLLVSRALSLTQMNPMYILYL
jgi:hypothetical protein